MLIGKPVRNRGGAFYSENQMREIDQPHQLTGFLIDIDHDVEGLAMSWVEMQEQGCCPPGAFVKLNGPLIAV